MAVSVVLRAWQASDQHQTHRPRQPTCALSLPPRGVLGFAGVTSSIARQNFSFPFLVMQTLMRCGGGP
jgi:hypothetical protein